MELFTETALGELLASPPSRGARQQLKLADPERTSGSNLVVSCTLL